MSDITSAKIQFLRDLSFNILGIPPSTEHIEHAKEQASSVIRHYHLFLKRTLIFSAMMLVMFALSAYFFSLGMGISTAVLLLMSFSALLAANDAFGSSLLFLFLASFMAILAFANQHIGVSAVVCVGLVCTSLPYFRIGILQAKKTVAEQRLAEYEAVDDDELPILNAWAEIYPACRHYFAEVSNMQRSVTRGEYKAAYNLVFELNRGFASRYPKGFNYVPFFFG